MRQAVYVRQVRQSPEVRLRLFCFPYAGGSEAMFHTWASRLPAAIDLCPVLLPGRGRRFGEPAFTHIAPLVEALSQGLAPYLDRPYGLFGYSMGALVSFELARALRRKGAAPPAHLFAASFPAPHLPHDESPVHELPDDRFIAHLKRQGGAPQAALANAELMALMLPQLRADFAICTTYRYAPEEPLACPITVYGGASDHGISRSALQAWEQHTSERFALQMLPGGHFFVHESEGALLQAIVREQA